VFKELMKKPFLFSISVCLTLLVAGFIAYKFGLPLLEDSNISCGETGGRSYAYGCQTNSTYFFTFLTLGVVIIISLLWDYFRD